MKELDDELKTLKMALAGADRLRSIAMLIVRTNEEKVEEKQRELEVAINILYMKIAEAKSANRNWERLNSELSKASEKQKLAVETRS